ncbi:Cytochrome P450 [Rhynchospora pubera]|uniref:Cytochrome P450 n=1 Tax=Rhynchospora pubera TaxID=906938 RepID=A0AAV8HAB8_9POAL|nr:Cytochrome P450 [Rhynchospora pubera]
MTGADPVILLLTVLLAPIIVILLVSRLWITEKKNGGDSKLPPGDKGWPIVGSTFSLFKPHPATTLGDFLNLQLSRYGKIFSTSYLGRTLVISADPEFNRFVLQNELRLFQNDLPSHIKTILGEGNLSFMTGETYKSTKSLVLGFFNSWQIQTRFLAEVEEAAKRVMTSWRQKSLILANEELSKFFFNLAIEKAMGLTPDDPKAEELRKAFIATNTGLYAVPLSLPFTRYSKALKARNFIFSIVKIKAEDRKRNSDKMDGKESDLIQYHLKNNPSLSMQSICDSVIGLIFATLFNTQIPLH